MRLVPLAAAFALILWLPPAHASGATLSLDAPATVSAARATTVDVGVALALDGVVCTSEAFIPVSLRVAEAKGMRTAQLALEEIGFRYDGRAGATSAWRADGAVPLTLWADAASGIVRLSATYALPSQCVVVGGASSGSASLTMRVEGATPQESAELPPPAAPRADAPLAPPPGNGKAARALPIPVLGAIAGTAVGGLVVLAKRLRLARA